MLRVVDMNNDDAAADDSDVSTINWCSWQQQTQWDYWPVSQTTFTTTFQENTDKCDD